MLDDGAKSARDKMRGLMAGLVDKGLTEYGAIIPSSVVHEMLDIKVPLIASRETFNRLSLIELAAIDYCRNTLLGEGKYITSTGSGYRILLPSENANQVTNYVQSADKKLSRALKLNRNMPKSDSSAPDQLEARIELKKSGMRRGYEGGQQVAV